MHPEIGQLAVGGSVPEMFFLAAEENVFPGSNLAGMTVCGDGQRALQHIDEDVAVERAPLVQEPARAYEIAAGVKGYGIWSKGIQAVHERFPPI